MELKEIEERIKEQSKIISELLSGMGDIIVGQEHLLGRLLIGLFCKGHILLEGVPGLAKTLAVKTLSESLDVSFKRIQFTPDLLPADLIGTLIFNIKTSEFYPRLGPIFAQMILADEINRAPAKVQSALLEAMQERQVTIGDTTHVLPEPFLVMATQNPIDQEGTYPLPEAQIDRFMLKVKVDYPSLADEKKILERVAVEGLKSARRVMGLEHIKNIQDAVRTIYVDERIKDYIVNIVHATRDPESAGIDGLSKLIDYGASPRASIYLLEAARALAFIGGRGFVIPEDIKDIGHDILRHRVILSYEAEAEEMDSDEIVGKILSSVEVP